jgi:hypothetical protein
LTGTARWERENKKREAKRRWYGREGKVDGTCGSLSRTHSLGSAKALAERRRTGCVVKPAAAGKLSAHCRYIILLDAARRACSLLLLLLYLLPTLRCRPLNWPPDITACCLCARPVLWLASLCDPKPPTLSTTSTFPPKTSSSFVLSSRWLALSIVRGE